VAAFQQARKETEACNAETLIARGVLELQARAIKGAVATRTRLADHREGLNGVALGRSGGRTVVAVVDALAEADVAWERMVEDGARTPRREAIGVQERRKIHLAALCAVGLRVGAELVSLLPVEAVEVVVTCELADATGGRPTSQPALQLLATGKALADHDWQTADAVSLAAALGARMDWSIETGFAPILVGDTALAKSA
jgi:hypothetical protein